MFSKLSYTCNREWGHGFNTFIGSIILLGAFRNRTFNSVEPLANSIRSNNNNHITAQMSIMWHIKNSTEKCLLILSVFKLGKERGETEKTMKFRTAHQEDP